MKTNFLKWSAIVMVIVTSITAYAQINTGQPYIVPFNCDRHLRWSDRDRRCAEPTLQSAKLPRVIGLILFTGKPNVMGVCRASVWDNCVVPISSNNEIKLTNSYATLYFNPDSPSN